jgi:molybdate transport system substrate-binding protein
MTWLRGLTLLLFAPLLACGSSEERPEPPVLGAAASLRRVMPVLLDAFRETSGVGGVQVTYASSGALRNQLVAGAPMDALVLASHAPVDDLIERGLVDPESKRLVARNTLVLIGPEGSRPLTFATLTDVESTERIAVGEPESVPAGAYAREALRALGIWERLRSRCVYTQDVAAVLAYVRRGEVAAGVVYGTETVDVDDIVVLDRAEEPWAPSPVVVAGVVTGAARANVARDIVAFLASERGQEILRRAGFASP